MKRRRTKEEIIWQYSAQLELARQAGFSERDLDNMITNLQNR